MSSASAAPISNPSSPNRGRGFHCQASKKMCVAAAKTNLKPGPVRSTKLDHCAGQDVEGADALWQGYADHDISSTDERPNARGDRPRAAPRAPADVTTRVR